MKTVLQASRALGVSPSTIRSWIAKCKIEFVRLGRGIRIPQHAIDDLIAAGTVKRVPSSAKKADHWSDEQ